MRTALVGSCGFSAAGLLLLAWGCSGTPEMGIAQEGANLGNQGDQHVRQAKALIEEGQLDGAIAEMTAAERSYLDAAKAMREAVWVRRNGSAAPRAWKASAPAGREPWLSPGKIVELAKESRVQLLPGSPAVLPVGVSGSGELWTGLVVDGQLRPFGLRPPGPGHVRACGRASHPRRRRR
jgi:hypothetical protein